MSCLRWLLGHATPSRIHGAGRHKSECKYTSNRPKTRGEHSHFPGPGVQPAAPSVSLNVKEPPGRAETLLAGTPHPPTVCT